jgi:hypothetical protein
VFKRGQTRYSDGNFQTPSSLRIVMPCHVCAHYLPGHDNADGGWCRLKSDATGIPQRKRGHDVCEFFDLDPADERQLAICRHCGGVTLIEGEVELCDACAPKFQLAQFLRESARDPEALTHFHCSRTFRERWLKQRLELKQGGKSGVSLSGAS